MAAVYPPQGSGGGGLSGLGSTDNAVLRADGTGGATAQGSGVTIDDSDNVAGAVDVKADTITLDNANGDCQIARNGRGQFALKDPTDVSGLGMRLDFVSLAGGTPSTFYLDWDQGSGFMVASGSLQVGQSTSAALRFGPAGPRFTSSGANNLDLLAGADFSQVNSTGSGVEWHVATELLSGLSGASASTTNLVPAGARIMCVSARVTTLIEGATTFDVGDGTDVDRYGAAIALTAGTTVDETDYTADPMSWSASAQDVTLTANGSNFTAGAVRVSAVYVVPRPPTS